MRWLSVCILLAVSPLASAQKPDLTRGEQLFENCATCHGPAGGGMSDGSFPRIAGQHSSVIVKQLLDYRHGRRWDPRMERYADRHVLPDAQAIADVAVFISQLDRMAPRGIGDGTHAEQGLRVYAARCKSCHGPDGEGNEKKAIPRVAGQHYDYLLRQMYDAADGRRPNFSRAHVRLLGKLEHEEIVGLADALSRATWR